MSELSNENNKNTRSKKCADCIHETACQSWNIGTIRNMDSTNCLRYEELKKSKNEALCEITKDEAKSMICTLDMFTRLAFNVHGLIDVIDDRNIKKMREILKSVQ